MTYLGKQAFQLVILDVTEREQAEHALRESEERFRNLSDTAPVLIWMAGVGRHTFYFNKTWLRFTGRSVGQEYGHGWKQSVHPDDLPRCMSVFQSAFESRAPFTLEYRLRHVDGTDHWVLDSGVPRFTADGSFAGYIGSCVDITTRRATEEALRESEQRFRELADFLPHTIFETDERGVITFVNRKGFEVFGYSVQDLQRGLNLIEMLTPADRSRAHENVARVLKGEAVHDNEYVAQRNDGHTFPVVVDSGVCLVDGKPTGLRGIVIDITEQKRAEEEMKRLNRALRTTGQCNQALVHAEDEATLLNHVCHIVVQSGGYRMAWVGYARDDGERIVEPVAHSGSEEDYLRTVTITWDDTDAGCGPTGTAIKSCKPCVNRDIINGVTGTSWRAEAAKRGYRSSIALPLIAGGACLGALNIYSGKTDAFDANEVQFLSQLADDLAYGISALRTRDEQRCIEVALRDSEMTLRRTFDQSPIGAGMVALDGHFVRANDALCQMLGYTREEMCALTFRDITHPDDMERDVKQVKLLAEGRLDVYETDKRYLRKDGSVAWGRLCVCGVKDASGKVVHFLPMVQDLTERKRTEEALFSAGFTESGGLASIVRHLCAKEVCEEVQSAMTNTMQFNATSGTLTELLALVEGHIEALRCASGKSAARRTLDYPMSRTRSPQAGVN